jgi:glycerophosphoryl diester phosphodiesterase
MLPQGDCPAGPGVDAAARRRPTQLAHHNPCMPAWPYPYWIAHRGAGRLAPENTLAAFRTGLALGWRAFECDVRLSADGQAFLLHDDTLERTTNGHGPAAALDWEALSRLDAGSWHSSAYRGQGLARLEDVAALLLAHGAQLNIEIKPPSGAELETGAGVARQTLALWRAAVDAGAPWPLLSSFSSAALAAAHAAAPELPCALLLDELPPDPVGQALALGCLAVVVHHPLLAAAPDLVGQAHAAGLRVLSFTVNQARLATRMRARGVDGLITDQVQKFRPQLNPGSNARQRARR